MAAVMTAEEAYEMAKPGNAVIGWKVDERQRAELLERFKPVYERAIADHVTLRAKVAADSQPPGAVHARIVGCADDGRGVQALVVDIDGGTRRPDGSTYHITWSLAQGRRAKESNDVIRDRGWEPFEPAVDVLVEPAVFR